MEEKKKEKKTPQNKIMWNSFKHNLRQKEKVRGGGDC